MVLFHAKGSYHGQKNLFPGAGRFFEGSHFIPVVHRHVFVYGNFGAIEFDLANIDNMIVTVNQQVELDTFFRFIPIFKKGRRSRVDTGYAKRFFDLKDVLEADVLKGITCPGYIGLRFTQLLPNTGAFLPVVFHELQVKKGKLIRQAIQSILFLLTKRLIG